MWMNFLDTDVVKFLIDVGTWLVKLIDNVGLLKTLAVTYGAYFVNKNFGSMLFGDVKSTKANIQELKQTLEEARTIYKNSPTQENKDAYDKAQKNLETYEAEFDTDDASASANQLKTDLDGVKNSTQDIGDAGEEAFEQLSFDLDDAGQSGQQLKINIDNVDQSTEILGDTSVVTGAKMQTSFDKAKKKAVALGKSILQFAKTMAIMYAVSTVIELVGKGISYLTEKTRENSNSAEVLHEKYQDLSDELSNCESEIRSLESELETTNEQIEELMSQGELTFVEQEELERLQAVSAELERQISMKKTLQSSLQAGTNSAAVNAGNAYLNTSFDSKKSKTERQEEGEEKGKTAGQIIGLVLAAAAAAVAAYFTGGLSLSALPSIAAAAGLGSAVGGAAGGAIGSAAAGSAYDQEQTVGDAIASMNASRDQLIKARDETYEAYVSDPTNTDKKAEYESAAQALSLYDEKMANHISQMSQYYNTITSGWANATEDQKLVARQYGDMIDAYNIEMGGVNAKANAIDRIFGEESDEKLKAVRFEMEKMARNGEEIDLKKAFGDDIEAYCEFTNRLYEMRIGISECEDAFKQMHDEAQAAADVDFVDIMKDIKGIAEALTGLKNAYEEFLTNGYSSVDTILDLSQYFTGEGLEEAYNNYVGIMMSGNSSIEEAQEATAELAKKFIETKIAAGSLTEQQKQVYVTVLKSMGINNAEEFITHQMQQAGLQKIKDEFSASENMTAERIKEIAKEYAIDTNSVDQLIIKLRKKKQLESNVKTAQNNLDEFNKYFLGEDGYGTGGLYGYVPNVAYADPDDFYLDTDFSTSNKKVYRHRLSATVSMDEETYNNFKEYVKTGEEKGFLKKDDNGSGYSMNTDLKENLEQQIDEAKAEVAAIEDEINADIVIDYNLKFNVKVAVNTLDSLTSALEQYKSAIKTVNEISFDGQSMSEDYYNTLRNQLQTLTVDGQDFFDAVVNNGSGYIVKDADLLRKLVAQLNKSQKAIIKVAKAQTRLKYKEVSAQIANCVDEMSNEYRAYGYITNATRDNLSAMRDQLQALKETVQQYTLLEVGLSNAAKAYDDYERAKERDANLTYDDSFLEMLKTIDQGILNNETGTEAFEFAVKAIVPPEVYEGLDDVDAKIKAIHDYIDGDPVFSQLFHVDEESGELDINADNVRNFVDIGLEKGVFDGDSTNFELSADIDSIEDVAKAMGISEAAALALLSSLEKVDATWNNVLTDLTTPAIERNVNKQIDAFNDATKAYDDYLQAVIDGEEEYDPEKANQLIDDIKTTETAFYDAELAAKDNAEQYVLYQSAIASYRGQMQMTTTEANALAKALGFVDENGNPTIYVDENGSLQLTDEQMGLLLVKMSELEKPTEMRLQLVYDNLDTEITNAINYLKTQCQGTATINGIEFTDGFDKDGKYVGDYLSEMLVEKKNIEVTYGITETSSEQKTILESYQELAENGVDFTVTADVTDAETKIQAIQDAIDKLDDTEITVTVTEKKNEVVETNPWWFGRGATVNANGTANAQGSWGAQQTETSLVGELGPEILVRGDKWFTVGENGAEFTQVRRGDIIFNHKQSEQLLKNGYVTGRGKLNGGSSAFAHGTAYEYGVPSYHPNDASTSFGNGSIVNEAWDDAASAMSDAADEFKETFDWIEVRLEKINSDIDLKNAQLENKIGYKAQNKTIEGLITDNKTLKQSLGDAKVYYEAYAKKLLEAVDADYRDLAQNGAIDVEVFKGEIGEEQLKAINEYREWVKKGLDVTQQAEETTTEISSLAKQSIDNIATQFDNEASLRDNKSDQLEAYNELLESQYGVGSKEILQQLYDANKTDITELGKKKKAMQTKLNDKVEKGEIEVGSQDWYDAVNDIAAIDTEIINLKNDNLELKDSMTEIDGYHFDLMVSQLDAVSAEADNLLDILGEQDAVDEMGNWTDAGITSLGLLAQQMEVAQKKSQEYASQIDYLNENWQSLGYTEEEYIDKLDELKDGQYDAIQSYNDSKDAIVDLNKERVDAIKNGIDKEIEAYEKLIDKKKEELDAESDLYDFQKKVRESSKDIADIERQLAALSSDNSASARAKRAQLEAELAEAKQEQEDMYYERSISNQQEALDKELENFKDQKDAEIEGWEEYLENTNQVVSDSLATVQANTDTVLQTLNTMGEEYSLNITESLKSPWTNGATAISDYKETFGTAVSETMTMLDELSEKYDETTGDLANEVSNKGNKHIATVEDNTAKYVAATKKPQTSSGGSSSGSGNGGSQTPSTKGMVSGISGTIAEGQSGDQVKKLQKALNAIAKETGWSCGGLDEDGKFGPKTLAAVKVFQKKMKLDQDGRVGPNTKKAFSAKGYAIGSKGVSSNQLAWIDELGEELRLVPDGNGRLAYIKKGTGILTADMTERLMDIAMDPQSMLDANRPSIGVHPEIHNTQIQIDNSIGELIHIDKCDQSTLPDVEKIVNKALEQHTQRLNQSLRKYAR